MMRVASACRNCRSWVMNSTAPRKSSNTLSSQAMVWMSRWLVGSSSNSTSGSATSAWASSTRRRQPPDSSDMLLSAGRPRRVSVVSTSWFRRQPSFDSSWCCTFSRRASSASPMSPLISAWYSASSSPTPASPAATTSYTLEASASGSSWGNWPIFRPGANHNSPSSAACSPVTTRIRLDLPAPLRPIRHTRSPRSSWKLTFSSRGFKP